MISALRFFAIILVLSLADQPLHAEQSSEAVIGIHTGMTCNDAYDLALTKFKPSAEVLAANPRYKPLRENQQALIIGTGKSRTQVPARRITVDNGATFELLCPAVDGVETVVSVFNSVSFGKEGAHMKDVEESLRSTYGLFPTKFDLTLKSKLDPVVYARIYSPSGLIEDAQSKECGDFNRDIAEYVVRRASKEADVNRCSSALFALVFKNGERASKIDLYLWDFALAHKAANTEQQRIDTEHNARTGEKYKF